MIIEAFKNREVIAPERQLMIFPKPCPDGSRMILATTRKFLAMSAEQIDSNREDFPLIAVIKGDGSIIVDITRCGAGEIYSNRQELLMDLNCILSANGIPEIA